MSVKAGIRVILGIPILAGVLLSGSEPDLHCPLYPEPQRKQDQARLDQQRSFQKFSATLNAATRRAAALRSAAAVPPSANFIDDFIFGKIQADGVPVAELTTDTEFLRRVTVDLTGRIPTAEQVEAFVNDSNPAKRDALIDSLLGSPAYVDHWTLWFADQFEVGSNYYNYVSIQSRNLFYRYVRDMVERDRPYNESVSEMISAAGDSFLSAPVNYLVRGYQVGDPIQDTWDAITNRITTNFLGVQTQCVSCHNGRNHLEKINLFLVTKLRSDFWKQSAFLSRMAVAPEPVNPYGIANRLIFRESGQGGYSSFVPSNNPGPRPPRTGGPYMPQSMFTGEEPRSSNWRGELARLITADRQFARATVNYLWAALFTVGIVDPPDGWDLKRIDPNNPPPPEFPLQATHPELLEALATTFINSGYSIKYMIRLMVQSSAYQLSSREPEGWQAPFSSYFAKHIPRRLTAEEAYDAVTTATGTETPMFVEGFDRPLMYAAQLPDTTEPRSDGNVTNFLRQLGRGDWFNSPRNSTSTILQVLFLMNDNQINFRTLGSGVNSRSTRVATLLASNLSEDEMVQRLFLSTLGRGPTEEEKSVVQQNRSSQANLENWLADLQWALLNKLDFLFNY